MASNWRERQRNATGENIVGFDAYLRYTFAAAGLLHRRFRTRQTVSYDAVTGNGDILAAQIAQAPIH